MAETRFWETPEFAARIAEWAKMANAYTASQGHTGIAPWTLEGKPGTAPWPTQKVDPNAMAPGSIPVPSSPLRRPEVPNQPAISYARQYYPDQKYGPDPFAGRTPTAPMLDPNVQDGDRLYYNYAENKITNAPGPSKMNRPLYFTHSGEISLHPESATIAPAVYRVKDDLPGLDPNMQFGERMWYDFTNNRFTNKRTSTTVPVYESRGEITLAVNEQSAPFTRPAYFSQTFAQNLYQVMQAKPEAEESALTLTEANLGWGSAITRTSHAEAVSQPASTAPLDTVAGLLSFAKPLPGMPGEQTALPKLPKVTKKEKAGLSQSAEGDRIYVTRGTERIPVAISTDRDWTDFLAESNRWWKEKFGAKRAEDPTGIESVVVGTASGGLLSLVNLMRGLSETLEMVGTPTRLQEFAADVYQARKTGTYQPSDQDWQMIQTWVEAADAWSQFGNWLRRPPEETNGMGRQLYAMTQPVMKHGSAPTFEQWAKGKFGVKDIREFTQKYARGQHGLTDLHRTYLMEIAPQIEADRKRLTTQALGLHQTAYMQFASGDAQSAVQSLLESYDIERDLVANDPTWSYTWIGQTDGLERQQQFFQAMAEAELQLQRPLSREEVYDLKAYFENPTTEFAGEMIFDWLNVMDVVIPSEIAKPIFGSATRIRQIGDIPLEGMRKVGGWVKGALYDAGQKTFLAGALRESRKTSAAKILNMADDVVDTIGRRAVEAKVDRRTQMIRDMGALGEAIENIRNAPDREAAIKAVLDSKKLGWRVTRKQIDHALQVAEEVMDDADLAPKHWGDVVAKTWDQTESQLRKAETDKLKRQFRNELTEAQKELDEAQKALNSVQKPTTELQNALQEAQNRMDGLQSHIRDRAELAVRRGMNTKAVSYEVADKFRRNYLNKHAAYEGAPFMEDTLRGAIAARNPGWVRDVLEGTALVESRITSLWVRSVLGRRLGWAVNNYVESSVRILFSSSSPALFGPAHMEMMGVKEPVKLSTTFAKEGITGAKSIKDRLAKRPGAWHPEPMNFLATYWDNFKTNMKFWRDMVGPERANKFFPNLFKGVQAAFTSIPDTVTDISAAIEYTLRTRLYMYEHAQNVKALEEALLPKLFDNLREKLRASGVAEDQVEPILRIAQSAWHASGGDTDKFRALLDMDKLSRGGDTVSNWIPDELYQMNIGMSADDQHLFLASVKAELDDYLVALGRDPTAEDIATFFDGTAQVLEGMMVMRQRKDWMTLLRVDPEIEKMVKDALRPEIELDAELRELLEMEAPPKGWPRDSVRKDQLKSKFQAAGVEVDKNMSQRDAIEKLRNKYLDWEPTEEEAENLLRERIAKAREIEHTSGVDPLAAARSAEADKTRNPMVRDAGTRQAKAHAEMGVVKDQAVAQGRTDLIDYLDDVERGITTWTRQLNDFFQNTWPGPTIHGRKGIDWQKAFRLQTYNYDGGTRVYQQVADEIQGGAQTLRPLTLRGFLSAAGVTLNVDDAGVLRGIRIPHPTIQGQWQTLDAPYVLTRFRETFHLDTFDVLDQTITGRLADEVAEQTFTPLRTLSLNEIKSTNARFRLAVDQGDNQAAALELGNEFGIQGTVRQPKGSGRVVPVDRRLKAVVDGWRRESGQVVKDKLKDYSPEEVYDALRHRRDRLVTNTLENEAAAASGMPLYTRQQFINDLGTVFGLGQKEAKRVMVPIDGMAKYWARRNNRTVDDFYARAVGKMTKDGDAALAQVDVSSREFQKWFGGSKTVDANNRPIVFYHGTTHEFTEFSDAKIGELDPGWYGRGFYFSPDPNQASNYAQRVRKVGGKYEDDYTGGNVIPVYLRMENPFYAGSYDPIDPKILNQLPESFRAGERTFYKSQIQTSSDLMSVLAYEPEYLTNVLRRAGYDGVIVGNWSEVVVFDHTQIRNAISDQLMQTAVKSSEFVTSAALVVDGELVLGNGHWDALDQAVKAGLLTKKGRGMYVSTRTGQVFDYFSDCYFTTSEGRLLTRRQVEEAGTGRMAISEHVVGKELKTPESITGEVQMLYQNTPEKITEAVIDVDGDFFYGRDHQYAIDEAVKRGALIAEGNQYFTRGGSLYDAWNHGYFSTDAGRLLTREQAEAGLGRVAGRGAVSTNTVGREITAPERIGETLILFQDNRASRGGVSWMDDGRAVIHAMESPDVSTVLHEMGHVWLRMLPTDDFTMIQNWLRNEGYNLTDDWMTNITTNREAHEHFAHAIERYFAEGQAPTPLLQRIFNDLKDFILKVYGEIKGSQIDVHISDEVRAKMDEWFASNPLGDPEVAAHWKAYSNFEQYGYDTKSYSLRTILLPFVGDERILNDPLRVVEELRRYATEHPETAEVVGELMRQIDYVNQYIEHVVVKQDRYMPPPMALWKQSDAIQTWIATRYANVSEYAGSLKALEAWKQRLLQSVNEGAWYTKQQPKEVAAGVSGWLGDAATLKSDIHDTAIYGGKLQDVDAPEGALDKTNRMMLDYSDYAAWEQPMRGFIPFWMFPSRSLPYWMQVAVAHPELVAFYEKYLAMSKRYSYQEGGITSNGEQLPSLRGYMPIPGTNQWFNPTAPLVFRYLFPRPNISYTGETEMETPVQRVAQFLMEESQMRGFSLGPLSYALLNQFAVGESYPHTTPAYEAVRALIPIEFVPTWWQRAFNQQMRRVVSPNLPDTWEPEVSWKDYLIEERILQDAWARIQDTNDPNEKLRIASEVSAIFKNPNREDDQRWIDTRLDLETDQYYRKIGSAMSGFYVKEFSPEKAEILATRDRYNVLAASINNEIKAELFSPLPDALQRYDFWTQQRYETPEGLLWNDRMKMSWVTDPETGEQAVGQQRRRDLMAEAYAQEEVSDAYYAALKEITRQREEALIASATTIPVSQEVKDRIWDEYWEARVDIEIHPMYASAKRPWHPGYKPNVMLAEHFGDMIWNMLNETRPTRNIEDGETYEDYQKRVKQWEAELPQHAERILPIVRANMAQTVGELNVGQDYDTVLSGLMGQFTPDGYTQWEMQNDTLYTAVEKAYTALYLDDYFRFTDGKSGDQRLQAEEEFKQLHPTPPTTDQMWEWVQEQYGDKFSEDQIRRAIDGKRVLDPEQRFDLNKSSFETQGNDIWDILSWANPGKQTTALRDKLVELGGDESWIDTWYDTGGKMSVWSKPEEVQRFHDLLLQAAAELKITRPTGPVLAERITARNLQARFNELVDKELGGAYGEEIRSAYWQMSTSERRTWIKQNRDLYEDYVQSYYDLRDLYAEQNPIWMRYYYPDYKPKSKSSSKTGGSYASGGYSGGGYYSGGGSYYRRYSGGGGSNRYYSGGGGGGMAVVPYRTSLRVADILEKLNRKQY
jgi:hypothetical protein